MPIKSAGFTLLEVLIALALLAILMLGLLKIAAYNTRNLWVLENTFIAEQIAHNRMLQLRLSGSRPESAEGRDDMGGRRWHWRAERAALHPLGQGLERYQISVFLEGDASAYASLIDYLPAGS